MGICHVVKNVLRKPVLIGLLESDIVKVRDMSGKAPENKVYLIFNRPSKVCTLLVIFGVMVRRTIGVSDYWSFGPMVRRNIGMSPAWVCMRVRSGRLKGGYNMLTKCKSFADAFMIQTCGNNKQLDIMQLRGARTAHVQQCSNRIASIQPSFL